MDCYKTVIALAEKHGDKKGILSPTFTFSKEGLVAFSNDLLLSHLSNQDAPPGFVRVGKVKTGVLSKFLSESQCLPVSGVTLWPSDSAYEEGEYSYVYSYKVN